MATICPFYQNKYQSGWAICIQFSPLFLEVSRLCIAATDKHSAAEHTAAVARLDIYNCNWDLPPPPPPPPPAETWKSTQVWRLLVAISCQPPIWMAWAGSALAILMGQSQPKLASVSRNAHPALPALWPYILLTQSRLRRGHCDSDHSASSSRLQQFFFYCIVPFSRSRSKLYLSTLPNTLPFSLSK